MEFSRDILILFSSLGVLNGLLLVVYFLFITADKSIKSKLIGFLFLALTVRVGKSVLKFFTDGLSDTFIHIGLAACLAIGPLLFLYIKASLNENFKFREKYLLHFLLPLALILTSNIWGYYEFPHLWHHIFQGIQSLWFIYILATIYILYSSRDSEIIRDEKLWILSLIIGITLIWLAYTIIEYTSYISGAITFSFLVYFLILLLLKTSKTRQQKSTKNRKSTNFATQNDSEFYKKLCTFLLESKVYKNPDITMPEIAKSLAVTPHYFSQFLNTSVQTNFSKFINHYRIEESVELIKNFPNMTIESIAYESGFNSLSTFYSAFKSIKQMTPAAYRNSL